MARSTIRLNHSAMQSYLDGSGGVRERLYQAAEPVAQALRDDPHDESGDFEAGVIIEEDHTDRLVLRVGSTDWKGGLLEANYGIHSRALDSAR